MSKFVVQNFGCRASQADGAAIESALAATGMSRTDTHHSADWVILNTCTVTANADDDVRQTVRRVNRENPGAKILVTGCYAQRAPEEISKLPGVSLVVGNSHKTQIPDLLRAPKQQPLVTIEAPSYHAQIHVGDIFARHDFLASPVEDAAGDRSRPNLKIQDGCNNRCSFCIIPFVRGRSRSMPVDEVLAQIRALESNYPEVVLSGINLGRWGREPGFSLRFSGLLRLILDQTSVRRIRLSSVEPMDWSDELMELVAASPRIAKHIHAPLQSGSDTVLRRMHRKYRPRHYEDRIRKARALMPEAAIGADVMVGFPGETDEEFEQTRRFIEDLPFTYLHVFTYSERPGTPAAESPAVVPMAVRKQRNKILRDLGATKHGAFLQSMIGRTVAAVSLDGDRSALSDNFLKVRLAGPCAPRRMINVQVTGYEHDSLHGAAIHLDD